MRILVTAHSIAPSSGGLRVGVLGICKGLMKRGHDVTLITSNGTGLDAMDVPAGVATEHEGVTVHFFPVQVRAFGSAFSIPLARALKQHVQQSDIVLIHSLYVFMSTVAAHYSRKFGVPYVLRPHGTLDPFLVYRRRWALKRNYIRLFEERNFREAAAVQYSSESEEAMTARFVKSPSKSIIIPEGIDLSEFDTLPASGTFRKQYPETTNKTLVLFLGRFHQKKGLELLISAFGAVAKRCPDAHLVLAGSGDDDYVKIITQALHDGGVASRATITGRLDNDGKLAALADADLFALPSYGENFGLAVVEAMACGVPVVISDKVGISEDVARAGAGLVTRCNEREIADAIEKLANDSALRKTLGENGRKLVEAKFTIDRMAERMDDEYRRLAGV